MREFNGAEAVCREGVIFAVLIDDADEAVGRRFVVGDDTVHLTDFEGRLVAFVVETDGEMGGWLFIFFHGRVEKHSQIENLFMRLLSVRAVELKFKTESP